MARKSKRAKRGHHSLTNGAQEVVKFLENSPFVKKISIGPIYNGAKSNEKKIVVSDYEETISAFNVAIFSDGCKQEIWVSLHESSRKEDFIRIMQQKLGKRFKITGK